MHERQVIEPDRSSADEQYEQLLDAQLNLGACELGHPAGAHQEQQNLLHHGFVRKAEVNHGLEKRQHG